MPLIPSGFGGTTSSGGGGLASGVTFLSGNGAPTNGGAGTGAGSADSGAIYLDILNGDAYINRASSSSVSWHGVILA